ncbi:MAG: sugar ABC transporter permease [Synechococcaceae cyanobacterium SM2_3_1]|nr:sugar ABC transporter permease [Synechococcaceae cyanobacterium SM2_3_1]
MPNQIPLGRKVALQKTLKFWQAYLLLLPAVSIVVLLFGGGLVLAFLQSVGLIGVLGPPQWNGAAYGAVLTNPDLFRSLGASLYIAGVATGLSLVGSLGLAFLLQRAGAWASFACQLTLPIPHLVGVVGMILLLSPQWTDLQALLHPQLDPIRSGFPPLD